MDCPSVEMTTFKYAISLPGDCEMCVKEGHRVKKGELLFSSVNEGNIVECDLASYLRVPPGEVKKHLLISLGAKVEKDQNLAEAKPFWGDKKIFKSPISGEVKALTEFGVLKICSQGLRQDYRSPLHGKVIQTVGDLVIEAEGEKIVGCSGWGRPGWGELRTFSGKENNLGLSEVSSNDKDTILAVSGSTLSGAFYKIEALEVKGLICGKIPEDSLKGEVGVIVAGNKDGTIPEKIWSSLKKSEGENVYIFGDEKYLFIPKE